MGPEEKTVAPVKTVAACCRLPVTATKQERAERHAAKMAFKKEREAYLLPGLLSRPSVEAPMSASVPHTKKKPADDTGPTAVGLSGFAQTGKTTVANYIEAKYGYRRQHIAEPLRAMLRTLLQRFGLDDELITRYLTGDLKEERIPCLGVTSRHAQITIGTEWGRDLIDNDLWARLWSYEAEAAGGKAMNDSVRFPNEEAAIQGALGGFTILIERPGTEPAAYIGYKPLSRLLYRKFGIMWGVHPSERIDRLSPDHVIVNDGTLEQLYAEIDQIFAEEGAKSCAA